MTVTNLLVKAKKSEHGVYQEVTADRAGWTSLNFLARRMNQGEVWHGNTQDAEWVIVLLGGAFSVRSPHGRWLTDNARKDVFSGLPHALYLPRRTSFELTAERSLDLACGWCTATEDHPARLITPEDVDGMGIEIRGGDNATRQINRILPPGSPCQRMVCVEVYTPAGSWSSFPPHKHDHRRVDSKGSLVEASLEETYFYKIDKPQGFALQRIYSPERGTDQAVVAETDDVVLVPFGHHPVAAAPGYNVYYLNFLAGSDQSLAGHDDPNHSWIHSSWKGKDPRVPLVTLEMNGKDA